MDHRSTSPPLYEGCDVPLEEWVQYPVESLLPRVSLDHRSLQFLEGLHRFGVVFLELVPDTKRTTRPWESFITQTGGRPGQGLKKAIAWLVAGRGLGFLPRGGLWVLDVDGTEEVEKVLSILADLGIEAPWIRTPSGGAHFYFRMPESVKTENLKHHICHPKDRQGRVVSLDFKFGHRTMLVAPGTLRNGRLYEPQTDWFEPPVLDPRTFHLGLELWHERQPFEIDPRPLKARISRACSYLSRKAPVSTSGSGGRKVLHGVCTHLVVFLDLSPHFAVHLMTHGETTWNGRCRDQGGKPYPWSKEELNRAATDAVNGIPAAGVKLWSREKVRRMRDKTLSTFMALLVSVRRDVPDRIEAMDLKQMYESWSGQEITADTFGRSARRAGLAKKLVTKARIIAYKGLNRDEVDEVLVRHPCVN